MIHPLPIADDANIIGRKGVTLLQARVEAEGWLFRRQDAGGTDFGVDAELEIVTSNRVTGRLFKGQIKSSDEVEWKNDECSVSVRTTTYNLWREMPLPTILFLVDITTGGIYWTPALAHNPGVGKKSLTIKFERGSDIQHDITALKEYLTSWFAVHGRDNILEEVPQFHKIFKELEQDIDHYDDWSEVFEELHDRLRLFYQHVLRLRLEVGLSNLGIPPMADWIARDRATWQMDTLSWAVFSELMKFIGPKYTEAFDRLCDRVLALPYTEDNYQLKNLAEEHRLGHKGIMSIYPSKAGNKNFQKEFEQKLKEAGVLKYPYFIDKP